jgi:hypothetical protein
MTSHPGVRQVMAVAAAALLAACASGPPPPDWQLNAKSAMDSAVKAYLVGDAREAERAMDAARSQIARTGRADLLARIELMHCAAQVASLVFGPCEGFERVRGDAAPAERHYAEHLAARPLTRDQIVTLPPAQHGVASAIAAPGGNVPDVRDIADPLSKLIATAVLFQAGQADPASLAGAIDTASEQGWRRPLLAWLEVQALRAERGGAADEARRLRRRIELVQQGR